MFPIFYDISNLEDAGLLPIGNSEFVLILLALIPLSIWAWRATPKEMTFQRLTKWKIEQEKREGVRETKDRIRRRFRWMTPLVLGACFAGAGVFLWAKGFNTRTVAVVSVTSVFIVPFVLWRMKKEMEDYLS